MSSLENMSALSEANAEAEIQQRLQSPEFWRRLELHRLAYSQSTTEQRPRIVANLLDDVSPRLLFLAVDWSHRQGADEIERKAIETALISVVSSPVGLELFQTLTVKALVVLGLEQAPARGQRCRALLQPPLLPAMVALLGDQDTGAAQAAADALVALCGAAASVNDVGCRRDVLAALASQLDEVIAGLTDRQASTPRLRFADTAARLMSSSESAFVAAMEVGAVALVTNLTQDSSDPLLQLNALELLEQMASSTAGARYLIVDGHLSGLLSAAGGSGEGESSIAPDPLLGTSALRTSARLLAKAAGMGLDLWNEADSSTHGAVFLRACAAHIDARDEAAKLAGLVAASEVAKASSAALTAMVSQEHGKEGVVLDAWLTLGAHKVEVKAAALHALASVLGAPVASAVLDDGDSAMGNTSPSSSERGQERSSLAEALFERLGTCNRQSPGGLIVGLARQPIPEIRHAAYDVMRCAVWQPGGWGLSAVFFQPGFREFLEKREVETSKVTKEWKFSVIEGVMQCPERGVLGQDVLDSFRDMLKQGPFFVPRAREVGSLE